MVDLSKLCSESGAFGQVVSFSFERAKQIVPFEVLKTSLMPGILRLRSRKQALDPVIINRIKGMFGFVLKNFLKSL